MDKQQLIDDLNDAVASQPDATDELKAAVDAATRALAPAGGIAGGDAAGDGATGASATTDH